jgi:hypothetical protein
MCPLVVANMTGQSRYIHGPSINASDCPVTLTGPSGYTYTEPVVAQNTQNHYIPQQQYVPHPTYQSHGAPCDHRSSVVLDRPWQDSRHSNAQPNEAHLPRTGGLPPDSMEKKLGKKWLNYSDKGSISERSYQRPYSHRFDTMPYAQGTRILGFSKFSTKSEKSMHEHVSQFLAHLGELVDKEAYCVCLFSLSLTGTTCAWYAALLTNSINSWEELEQKLHEHFFLGEHELELADLASVRQGNGESINGYPIHVTDKQLAGLAFNVLLSHPGFKGPKPGHEIITKCARIKSHTYDDSWYRNECHIINI